MGKVVKTVKRSVGFVKDVAGGITGYSAAKAAKDAEERAVTEAAKQAALIAKQEEALDKKRKVADNVAAERKDRMNQNQLLSGTETGVAAGLLG